MPAESIQSIRPLSAVRLQPLIEVAERLTANAVETPLRVRPHRDESSVSQHPEVPGDTGLTHFELVDQLADGAFADADGIQNLASIRLRDRLEYSRRQHVPRITGRIYKHKHM